MKKIFKLLTIVAIGSSCSALAAPVTKAELKQVPSLCAQVKAAYQKKASSSQASLSVAKQNGKVLCRMDRRKFSFNGHKNCSKFRETIKFSGARSIIVDVIGCKNAAGQEIAERSSFKYSKSKGKLTDSEIYKLISVLG